MATKVLSMKREAFVKKKIEVAWRRKREGVQGHGGRGG